MQPVDHLLLVLGVLGGQPVEVGPECFEDLREVPEGARLGRASTSPRDEVPIGYQRRRTRATGAGIDEDDHAATCGPLRQIDPIAPG